MISAIPTISSMIPYISVGLDILLAMVVGGYLFGQIREARREGGLSLARLQLKS